LFSRIGLLRRCWLCLALSSLGCRLVLDCIRLLFCCRDTLFSSFCFWRLFLGLLCLRFRRPLRPRPRRPPRCSLGGRVRFRHLFPWVALQHCLSGDNHAVRTGVSFADLSCGSSLTSARFVTSPRRQSCSEVQTQRSLLLQASNMLMQHMKHAMQMLLHACAADDSFVRLLYLQRIVRSMARGSCCACSCLSVCHHCC